jgi:hypothetical protein
MGWFRRRHRRKALLRATRLLLALEEAAHSR